MPAYFTSFGTCLPNDPIPSEEIEEYVGAVGSSEVRDLVIKNSGIRQRHYAIDKEQNTTHRQVDLTTAAIRQAVERSELELDDIEVIAVGGTSGDLACPSLAAMTHGELMERPVELVSAYGFCASGMIAMKPAYMMVRDGEFKNAAICAAEMPSRQFKSSRYANGQGLDADGKLPFDVAFLRYMLSDGAGAAVIQDRPATSGVSYRIEWVVNRSFAHTTEPCMYLGSNGQNGRNGPPRSWQDYPTIEEANQDGAMSLRQNMRLLPRYIKTCGQEWARLIREGYFDPDEITRVAMHYSSDALLPHLRRAFGREGVPTLEDRWYTNLHTVGNMGSASIWVMVEELHRKGELEPGEKLLCFCPESGRFTVSMMLLTAVGPEG
ncbi:MAG: 3-oxoacyl-ACP synthase [Actinomycetota bacterium]|nr:3-oxoacyl-ACP synthase [Actinomycetota bacterium]